MARPHAAQRTTDIPRTAEVAPLRTSEFIRFDPELAVRAITFHLVDEGISPRVDEPSARAATARLRRGAVQLSITHDAWSEMTNPQRLEWLLERTQTVARLVSDELSVLEPAR